MAENQLEIYEGNGRRLSDRTGGRGSVPEYAPFAGGEHPKTYIASPGLRHAVNVAVKLGMPLLLTGKPGTGKTRLAASVAWELGLPLLTFHTKTTSDAADLFYHYDAILRFQDARERKMKPLHAYVTCRALGLAILLTRPTDEARKFLPEEYKHTGPTRSVVLIDEIDKAPRDLPNDVLNEIEEMKFRIRESDLPPFEARKELRPIVILTSNSEKNLPDAFLRRCVFYHIPSPERDDLRAILTRRFTHAGIIAEMSDDFIDKSLDLFERILKLNLKKEPGTAECLAWVSILHAMKVNLEEMETEDREKIKQSLSVLAKNKADLDRMTEII